MLIGVDIDGVLFPWADYANEALIEHFGIPDPGPHVEWEHLRNTITAEQWKWLWSEQGQERVFSNMGCYPEVVNAVNRLLKRGNEVHFVTHRDPRRTAINTAVFLTTWFGRHPWGGLHVVQNSTEKRGLLDWDVFVDDKPETVLDFLLNSRAHVFMPDRPWNTGVAGGHNFTRYDDPWIIAAYAEMEEVTA